MTVVHYKSICVDVVVTGPSEDSIRAAVEEIRHDVEHAAVKKVLHNRHGVKTKIVGSGAYIKPQYR